MKPSTTCRVVGMMARLTGEPEDDFGERCREKPTIRVLMLADPAPGLQVEVTADLCDEHSRRASNSPNLVTSWPITNRFRPGVAATSTTRDVRDHG